MQEIEGEGEEIKYLEQIKYLRQIYKQANLSFFNNLENESVFIIGPLIDIRYYFQ